MTIHSRQLRPEELARLFNSAPLGEVANDRGLIREYL